MSANWAYCGPCGRWHYVTRSADSDACPVCSSGPSLRAPDEESHTPDRVRGVT